jgi:cell division protein FtsN
MSPRDYKHSVAAGSERGNGLVVALGVYLWSANLPRPPGLEATPEVPAPVTQAAEPEPLEAVPSEREPEVPPESTATTDFDPPAPRFDFYKILPEMEVPVKDWELEEQAANEDPVPAAEEAAYVLQVGSFKNYADADRAKASLALRGILANVQRVVINGHDVWFRVHIGPVSDVATLRALRGKLTELDMDFILLRLGGPTQH